MKLFDTLYGREGRGVEKDAPPKTGLALFFEIVLRDGWDLCKLAALFVLCCIPVVTIPAALCALHTAVMRIVRDLPGDWLYDFKTGFRRGGKQAYLCSIPALLLPALLVVAFRFYYQRGGALSALYLVCGAMLVITMLAWVYLFPLLTTVQLRTRDIFKNALLLGIVRLRHSLPVLLLWGALLLLGLLLPPLVLPFWAVLGIALGVFTADFLAWHDLQTYIIQPTLQETK